MPKRAPLSRFISALYPVVLSTLVFCSAHAADAPASSVVQTQSKLKQVNDKINLLRQTLASAHDRRGALNKELSGAEKQISEGVRQLRTIQQSISAKELKIAALQKKADDLHEQLVTQQQLLAKHVRARYQIGEYQPLKWLINQDDPYKINRLFTYYQYVIKSRQELIDHIDLTRKTLNENKEQLSNELEKNKSLKDQLTQNQQKLEKNKSYHSALIESLDSDIQSKKQALSDFEKDKNNLSRLLSLLAQQSAPVNSKPFISMRKKLPLPIHAGRKSMGKMNQGVTFFADEGTVVSAVHPGKVVFSDWLKGYGLLLIIDHGQGFMTLYAHNQSLFKKSGERVLQNEQIASVGHSGGIKQNGLYFEIRQKGKAISPLEWLS